MELMGRVVSWWHARISDFVMLESELGNARLSIRAEKTHGAGGGWARKNRCRFIAARAADRGSFACVAIGLRIGRSRAHACAELPWRGAASRGQRRGMAARTAGAGSEVCRQHQSLRGRTRAAARIRRARRMAPELSNTVVGVQWPVVRGKKITVR